MITSATTESSVKGIMDFIFDGDLTDTTLKGALLKPLSKTEQDSLSSVTHYIDINNGPSFSDFEYESDEYVTGGQILGAAQRVPLPTSQVISILKDGTIIPNMFWEDIVGPVGGGFIYSSVTGKVISYYFLDKKSETNYKQDITFVFPKSSIPYIVSVGTDE